MKGLGSVGGRNVPMKKVNNNVNNKKKSDFDQRVDRCETMKKSLMLNPFFYGLQKTSCDKIVKDMTKK
jgi:hypothetical protein